MNTPFSCNRQTLQLKEQSIVAAKRTRGVAVDRGEESISISARKETDHRVNISMIGMKYDLLSCQLVETFCTKEY